MAMKIHLILLLIQKGVEKYGSYPLIHYTSSDMTNFMK